MAFSMSASLSVFGNPITITPNSKVPTRIESTQGFTITGSDITTFTNNFPSLPPGLNYVGGVLAKDLTSVEVSHIVVDTVNKDFQVAIEVDFSEDFFLNQYPDILKISSITAFLSCNKPAAEAVKSS